MAILVCGGAGYIGSHTCVELLNAGYEIIVADNLCNSSEEALRRVEQITGKKAPFVRTELCREEEVEALFAQYPDIRAVIHFAGLKAVGESVSKPLEYYSNNLISTLYLLQAMRRHDVKNFVFSSSATVYGDPVSVPIREDFQTGGHESLRHHQAVSRAHPVRLLRRGPQPQRGSAALLQPHRRARERPDRRGPQRHPQ